MKRATTVITLIVIVTAFAAALIYLWGKNQEDLVTYNTEKASMAFTSPNPAIEIVSFSIPSFISFEP